MDGFLVREKVGVSFSKTQRQYPEGRRESPRGNWESEEKVLMIDASLFDQVRLKQIKRSVSTAAVHDQVLSVPSFPMNQPSLNVVYSKLFDPLREGFTWGIRLNVLFLLIW
jgi:hypothetical protein